MKKPKVAFIYPAIGESFGGPQIFVMELAEKLRDRCDVTILASKKESDLCNPIFFNRERKYDNRIIYPIAKKILKRFTPTPDVLLEQLPSYFPTFMHLLNNDYDVILPSHDWGSLFIANGIRKIKGTPVIFTEHNGLIEKCRIISRNLDFNPDKFITLSEEVKFWVKKYYPNSKVEYIPNGVDFSKFNPDIKPKELDLPKPIILSTLRYQLNQRLDLLIEATAKIDASLLILNAERHIETLTQKGESLIGKDRFKMMTVPYSELPEYYRACDIFSLPSLFEPYGQVYLEALACNKPIVAPLDPTRTELIDNAGILCDVTDLDSYSKSLESALKTDFGRLPYNQALKYSWDETANKYYEIIKSYSDKH